MNRSRSVLWLLTALALGGAMPSVGAAAPGATPPAAATPAAASAASSGGVRLRRFALMIGVNDGGATRTRLRYAASDARSMARVLQNLGGVAAADLVFVVDSTRAATLQGFTQIEALMRAGQLPGVRRELLVYYSGHSDEDGLLLGSDRVTYDELRARIKQLPAELRVAILDSCASGAFTRFKGGLRRPPFLVDASTDMRGHVFLTSSAANEVAQESDRIAASFFTHFLVSGLRGAADVNQDHRVTLQEAYQFASQETLARTERTRGGPQHAAYEFDLSGTGDMVVTDVRNTQASLVLSPELSGRITVRESGGALVAELRKPAGNTIELGVEAGSYVVAMEASGGTTFEATTTLASGQRTQLARLAFRPGKPLEVAVARGDAPVISAPAGTVTATPAAPQERVGTKLGILPRPSDGRTDVNGFSFGLVGDRAARLDGFQLALGWTQADQRMHGMQAAIGATLATGDVKGLQMSNGVTYAGGRFRGVQLSGIAGLTRGDARGLQMSGLANLDDGGFGGVQMAGIVNRSGHTKGLQMGGVVNIAESMRGLQMSPVNIAGDMRGMQMGVVNVAEEGGGFRFGVVNVARRTRGFQFGVVNVARQDDGESFALLSIIGNGIHDVTAYATDAMLTNVAFKLGGRHLYTSLGVAYQPGDALPGAGPDKFGRGTRRWGTGLGLGWRFPVAAGRLQSVEVEAHGLNVYEAWTVTGTAPMLNSLRLVANVNLAPHVTVVAGVSGNVAVGPEGTDLDLSLGGPQKVVRSGTTTVRIYPGFVLGLQI